MINDTFKLYVLIILGTVTIIYFIMFLFKIISMKDDKNPLQYLFVSLFGVAVFVASYYIFYPDKFS